MEFKHYWNLFLKNLVVFSVLSVLGASLGLIYSLASPKIYEATSQIFISTPTPVVDISALQQGSSFAEQRVVSYARLVNGPKTLIPVIDKLGLNLTTAELARKISGSAPAGTVLINITVSDISGTRAAAIANAVALQFGETIEELELPQIGDSSGVKSTLVRSAVIPDGPSSPRTSLNIMIGLMFGFSLACGIGMLKQIFDSTVKNQSHLAGKPLLSTVFFDANAAENPLLVNLSNYSVRSESFRHLRTALSIPVGEVNCKVIAITSALPGEGKTTTSINLAIAYSQIGLKVALVEADLRRPTFVKYFQVDGEPDIGLSDILYKLKSSENHKNFERFFQVFGDEENCVEWLSCGEIPSNPAELLGSSEMSTFLSALRREYDIVIVDTPPALPVTDAAVLSANVDGVIIVAKAGVTRKANFQGVVEMFENLKIQVLGVVLNMVPINSRGEEYGYTYSRYSLKRSAGYGYGYPYGYGYSEVEPYGPLALKTGSGSDSSWEKISFQSRLKGLLARGTRIEPLVKSDLVESDQNNLDHSVKKLLESKIKDR